VIVTNGFLAEPVRWQSVTFPPVVVVVGVVVVVPVVVLVDVVVVVGTVVVVVLDVEVVVGVVVEVLIDVDVLEVDVDVGVEVDVEVLDVVEVDVLEVELVDSVEPVVDVVVSCCDEATVGPRTPRAAATPSPLRSASAASVAAKRAVRRGRGFTGVPPGGFGSLVRPNAAHEANLRFACRESPFRGTRLERVSGHHSSTSR
jgi:hypothetical protein